MDFEFLSEYFENFKKPLGKRIEDYMEELALKVKQIFEPYLEEL